MHPDFWLTPAERRALATDYLADRVHAGDSVHVAAGELMILDVDVQPPDRVTIVARLAPQIDQLAISFTVGA